MDTFTLVIALMFPEGVLEQRFGAFSEVVCEQVAYQIKENGYVLSATDENGVTAIEVVKVDEVRCENNNG